MIEDFTVTAGEIEGVVHAGARVESLLDVLDTVGGFLVKLEAAYNRMQDALEAATKVSRENGQYLAEDQAVIETAREVAAIEQLCTRVLASHVDFAREYGYEGFNA